MGSSESLVITAESAWGEGTGAGTGSRAANDTHTHHRLLSIVALLDLSPQTSFQGAPVQKSPLLLYVGTSEVILRAERNGSIIEC